MTDSALLLDRARAWLAQDPDPETREVLGGLIEQNALAELRALFGGELEFGTAGLRGVVGPGPLRMNRANVIRTTRAVAEHVLARKLDPRSRPVVVGHDARLSSPRFAADAVGVLLAASLPVRAFAEPVPTPLVAHAARALSASAAIAITASHNPREYNGYKLYDDDAVQIVPPADREIAARIRALPGASELPRVEPVPGSELEPDPALIERYFAEIAADIPHGERFSELRIVYSPLHGVGAKYVERALSLAGFSQVTVVPEQAEPDGHFPTTPFPNPEEPGVMDLSLALAERSQADLVLVNDPDADRLAVAVPTPSGRFVSLSGNEIGLLFADYLLERAPQSPRPLVVSSLVSSPMLDRIADAHGAALERTLTGFKWIWTAIRALESGALRFAFAYEEALGYSVTRAVRDKDGISAALCFAVLAADCRARGESVLERLYGLFERHGLWVSAQHNLALSAAARDAGKVQAVLERAATFSGALAGRKLSSIVDHRRPSHAAPPWCGPSEMIELRFGPGLRALVRPSGTEPKLKLYVDLEAERDPSRPVGPAREQAVAQAAEIARELSAALQPG